MQPYPTFSRPVRLSIASALATVLVACGGSGDALAPPAAGAPNAAAGPSIISTPTELLTAVVDAGSSGSRIHLYQVTPDGAFVNIAGLFTNKNVPHGLSYYDGSNGPGSAPSDAGSAGIAPLLAALSTHLSSEGISKDRLRVNVLATAGMRLVDVATANTIYDSVRSAILQNGYRVGQVGTITGQSEGLYSWADVNFLNGNFKAARTPQGIVEVGGASSQVAFATANRNAPNVVVRTINGVDYPVFSVSYLGLGQTEARRAMIGATGSGGLAANVCYPNNTSGAPTAFDPDIGEPKLSTTGANFSSACYTEYQKVITTVSANGTNNYPITQISSIANFASTQFVGVSSIYNVLKDWGALNAANPQRALEDALNSKCTGPNAWPRVLEQYKNITTVFSQSACANGAYLNTYVYGRQSLNINPAQLSSIAAVGENELTWTRGFVLLEAAR